MLAAEIEDTAGSDWVTPNAVANALATAWALAAGGCWL
jgi:hypothetical protein